MQETKNQSLVLVENDGGFANRCGKCGNIVSEGDWAIMFECGGQLFLIGDDPPLVCTCGAQIESFRVFSEEDGAEKVLDNMVVVMNRLRSADSFKLIEFNPEGPQRMN